MIASQRIAQSPLVFNLYLVKMPNTRRANLNLQCRLCGVDGHHEIDIWTDDSHNVEFTLNEKIFECIGVRVCDTTVNDLTLFHPWICIFRSKETTKPPKYVSIAST